MKRALVCLLAILLLAVAFLPGCSSGSAASNEINIGVLACSSGGAGFLGQASVATLEVAAQDINDHLSAIHSDFRVKLNVHDTQSNPEIAMQQLKDLAALGIRYVVMATSSAELTAVKDYAVQKGLILVSPTSTVLSLAVDDNIYRFVLNDLYQARAISRLISDDKVSTLVPLYRGDVWGDGLVNSVKSNLEKLGIQVTDGFRYPTDTTDFAPALAAVESQIQQASGKAAVYLVSFDEAISIFNQASGVPALGSVQWYGSDGTAADNKLVSNSQAAAFAVKTGFVSPAFGLASGSAASLNAVSSRVKQNLGWESPASTLTSYDILWIGVQSYLNCGKTSAEFADLKASFLRVASSYYGISGNTALDASGDVTQGSYLFWTVNADQGAYAWHLQNTLLLYPTHETWNP